MARAVLNADRRSIRMKKTHAHRGAIALLCSLSLQACLSDADVDVDEAALAALAPPTNLQVEVTSPTGVRVTWDPSPGATRYLVQRGPTPGSETTIVSVLAPSTTWVYNHIPAGTHYCWVVRNLDASNQASGPSNEVCTAATSPGPATPADVAAAPVSPERIRITWSPVADAELYRVYGAAAPAELTFVGTTRAPSTLFNHVGLAHDTTYRYAVVAVNGLGASPPSPIVEATTQGTRPPVTVGVVATAPTTITIGWAPVADATSYEVFAAVVPATPVLVGTVAAPTRTFTHAGLAERTTYGYQVRAIGPMGPSVRSTPILTASTTSRVTPVPPPVGECRTASGTQSLRWCWVYPLPQGNPLRDVSEVGGEIRVIGDRGAVRRYLGGEWPDVVGRLEVGWPAGHADIWGRWAATGTGGVFFFDGLRWQAVPGVADARVIGGLPDTSFGTWVYGAAPPAMLQRAGSAWENRGLPAPGWETLAIGGERDTQVRVVGRDGRIARWSGNAWTLLSAGIRPANDAVVINNRAVVLAQDSTVARWHGSYWTTLTPPVPGPWLEVAAASLDDIWIARAPDASGRPRRYHWDGATWTAIDAPSTVAVNGMAVTSEGAMAVLADGTAELWTGGPAWTPVTVGDNTVRLTAGTDDDDVWIVSDERASFRGLRTRHWDGTAWRDIEFPFQPAAGQDLRLTSMWAAAPGDVWLAGGLVTGGTTARRLFHWDGAAWSSIAGLGGDDALAAVWGTAPDDVYAVAPTALHHFDGIEWTVVADVPGGTDVFGSGAGDVTVLDGTTVWRWDGAAWSALTAPEAVWRGVARSPTEVWLQGTTGTLRWDGSAFQSLDTGGGADRGVPLDGSPWMVTFTTVMKHWVGGVDGSPRSFPIFFDAWSWWRSPSGRLFAAGTGLVVLPGAP
jgi:hypothetical protein